MKRIAVSRLVFEKEYPPMAEVSAEMDKLRKVNRIDQINWDITSYKPEVYFKIAYHKKEIYIKYFVREKYVKAEKTGINQDVYEDSCVEFFVSPRHDDGIYYNFEFNSIGAFLAGSGTGRHNSKRTDPAMAGKIRCLPSMGNEPFPERVGDQEWTLTVVIHTDILFRHKIDKLSGSEFRANFYKCGDALSKPHYLSWNPVLCEKPDFHRPEYFGIIHFE